MSATILPFTDRQKREKEFYDQYVYDYDFNQPIDFSPVTALEARPWNSYWAVYQLAKKVYLDGSRLLDFGSGPGENALRFSKIGYTIEGFDISSSNVAVSRMLFERHGLKEKAHFQVALAENLPYPDNHFDVIAGIDILHHVDILQSIRECHRVLRPGGLAIFREPLQVDTFDWIRNTSFVKLFFPKHKSFDLHITEDERKLKADDIEIIRSYFPRMKIKRYFFLARFDKLFREGSDPRPSLLEKLDHFLMEMYPFLKKFGGAGVIILRKE